jgi:hypothetical protein
MPEMETRLGDMEIILRFWRKGKEDYKGGHRLVARYDLIPVGPERVVTLD